MRSRIENIYAKLNQKNLDVLIVSSPPNISYLTEFSSRDAYLIISKKENIYITDSRYTQEARQNLGRRFKIKIINGSVFKLIADACQNLGLKRIGFEERHLIYAEYIKIKEGLRNTADLTGTHSLIEESRQIKDSKELAKIKKATDITSAALESIEKFIAPGKKEIEVAGEIERFIRYQGASDSAFNIIVAGGQNSSFPHHQTSRRKLKNNEPVLVDIGAEYLGYKSDLTRVFFLGKIDVLTRKIYEIVLKAQDEAIRQIRPGMSIARIDALARNYISCKGYGGFFSHNLGHGIGLEVHEDPHISAKEKNKLEEGMVFTVEPAIYLPGKCGIRIEDVVLVTQKGARVLSGSLDK